MLDTEDLDLSHLTIDDFIPGIEDDLSEDGFGAAKRKKRKKAKARRKPARRKPARRKAKARRKPARRKPARKAKAKKATRRKTRRRRRVAGLGSAVTTMANALAGNLGKAKRKKAKKARKPRRKSRKLGRVGKVASVGKPRRRRRKAKKVRRRKVRRMSSLGSLSNAVGRLSYSEVKKTAPVIGGFQWLFSRTGLESVGGGAGSALVCGLMDGFVMPKVDEMINKDKQMDPRITMGISALVTSIAMWELGKVMKSGMVSKIGFLYPILKYADNVLVQPYIVNPLLGKNTDGTAKGFGQMRVPDQAAFSGLGQVRLPESTELVGLNQVRLPEDSEDGFEDVMMEEDLQGVGQAYEAEEGMEENVF